MEEEQTEYVERLKNLQDQVRRLAIHLLGDRLSPSTGLRPLQPVGTIDEAESLTV